MHSPPVAVRPRPMIADDEDPDTDTDYEDQLIGLVARLEPSREGLAAATAARRPAQALTRANELMRQVVAFADRHFPFAGPDLREANNRGAEFRTTFERLRDPAGTPPEVDRLALTRRCVTAMCDAVLAYFTAFTGRFPTSRAARGWVEVAATFSAELKRTARDVAPPRQ